MSSNTEKLPKLPRFPEFPRLEDYKNQSLPKFPSSQLGEQMANDAIKDSIKSKMAFPGEQEDDLELGELEEPPTFEKIKKAEQEAIREVEEIEKQLPKKKSVFVKIEKFRESYKIFNDVKDKVQEIEGLLSEIKDVKKREEYELEQWKEEMAKLKEKMGKIDEKLFSKIN